MPQAFHTTAQTTRIRTLSLPNLTRFVALIIAAKQYRQYLEFELDPLVRHLQPHDDAAKTVMHLLAASPKKVSEAAMLVRTSESLSRFCYEQGWQVGFVFRAMNKHNYDLSPPFTQPIHLQQAVQSVIAAVVLLEPVTRLNVSADDLNGVLNRVLQDPLILLNYPIVGNFQLHLAEQQAQSLKWLLTLEELEFLNTSIAKDFTLFRREIIKAMLPAFGRALKNNRSLLCVAILFISILFIYRSYYGVGLNTNEDFSYSANCVVGTTYLLMLTFLVMRLIHSAFIQIDYSYQEKIHTLVEKLKLFLNLLSHTHNQPNQRRLNQQVQNLETSNMVATGSISISLILEVWLTLLEFNAHPLQRQLKVGTANVAVSEINQAKISNLISQTIWHQEHENRPPEPVNPMEALYHV